MTDKAAPNASANANQSADAAGALVGATPKIASSPPRNGDGSFLNPDELTEILKTRLPTQDQPIDFCKIDVERFFASNRQFRQPTNLAIRDLRTFLWITATKSRIYTALTDTTRICAATTRNG
ncbi:MAG: hypothetical protein LBI57_01365 [Helicobacteraceae bacterium]|nr:hypothetical protein [Helicobacteraceae bacterium]